MSPQPTKPASTDADNGAATTDTTPAAAETAADRQITRAKALEKERHELNERITKNRDYLRLMDANGELTDEQGEWLDAFYPLKEKGERRSDAEIEKTRKLKEEARKS